MRLGVFERKFRCFVKISTILLDILCRRKNKITWLKNYSCEWSNEQKKNILGWIKRLFLSRPSSVCYLECQEREIFCEFSNFNRNHYARRINKKEKKERGWEDFARTGLLSVANVYNEFHENQKWMMELKFKNEKKKQKRKKKEIWWKNCETRTTFSPFLFGEEILLLTNWNFDLYLSIFYVSLPTVCI